MCAGSRFIGRRRSSLRKQTWQLQLARSIDAHDARQQLASFSMNFFKFDKLDQSLFVSCRISNFVLVVDVQSVTNQMLYQTSKAATARPEFDCRYGASCPACCMRNRAAHIHEVSLLAS